MSFRGFSVAVSLVATAVVFFVLGSRQARQPNAREDAAAHATPDAGRADGRGAADTPGTADTMPQAATGGRAVSAALDTAKPVTNNDNVADRAEMVAEIKREIESEMGLLPVQLLRDRRSSFVGLYVTDDAGRTDYATAGYLGHGYFITVKHVVMVLKDGDQATGRKIVSIAITLDGKEIPATLIDAGDAKAEVDRGDWAIVQTKELDLPALHPDIAFAYEFAEPIFRLGNDYSKGIILSTGYVGERTANGLVTCLTDGHPGVSGGGVLDQRGDLVGIPIGRMDGDYRFSFILPLRAEMLRKVPFIEHPQPVGTFADAR